MSMKWIGLLVFIAAAGVCGEDIKIKATKKTADRDTGDSVALPSGESRYLREEVYYKFEITRMSPSIPSVVSLEYMLFRQEPDGKIERAVSKKDTVSLTLGMPVTLETDKVLLKGREWTGRRSGEFTQELAGYGIILRDRNGETVYEVFEPSSIEKLVDKFREKQEEQAQEQLERAEEAGQDRVTIVQPDKDVIVVPPRKHKPLLPPRRRPFR